jgi:SAM-dependent methyltransferase
MKDFAFVIQLIFGFYPRKIIRRLRSLPWFIRSKRRFIKLQNANGRHDFGITGNFPCLLDRNEEGGSASGHYFHQDLWVAQEIAKTDPACHVDIGSRIDGFVAHVASFRKIEVFDIQDITPEIPNVKFVKADCMSNDFRWTDYCDSVSSLHAIEHFGLGRYGDPLDPDGHIKGLNNICKMLKQGGLFYFSVPIGAQRIEFNAHRVFSVRYLLDYFKGKYEIEQFSFVDDKGNFHRNVTLDEDMINGNCRCRFGCGIFVMRKK